MWDTVPVLIEAWHKRAAAPAADMQREAARVWPRSHVAYYFHPNTEKIAIFAPLVVLTLWMGVYPSSFTHFFDASVGALVEHHQAALAATTKLAGVIR